MKCPLSLVLAVSLSLVSLTSAQDYLGASAFLKRLAEVGEEPPADPLAGTPVGLLKGDLEAFQKVSATLSATDAVSQWLALVDRYFALTQEERWTASANLRFQNGDQEPFGFGTMLTALPPPATWPDLVQAIEARAKEAKGNVRLTRYTALKIIGHTLVNQPAARWSDFEQLRPLLAKSSDPNTAYRTQYLLRSLLNQERDPQRIVAAFEENLAAVEKNERRLYGGAFQIPDLALLTDEATAKKLLRRALLLPTPANCSSDVGETTRTWARQVAAAATDQVKTPPWDILESLEATALFEAMNKKFPPKIAEDFSSRERAAVYYVLGLVVANRADDAVKFAVSSPLDFRSISGGLDALEAKGRGPAAFAFLQELISRQPENTDVWPSYIALSARLGKTDLMLATLRATLARENLPAAATVKLHEYQAPALLAGDKTEEAVAELRTVANSPAPTANTEEDTQPVRRSRAPSDNRLSSAITLARIGKLMERPEWIEDGLNAARRLLDARGKAGPAREDYSEWTSLLEDLGRGPEVEKLLLETALRQSHSEDPSSDPWQALLLLYSKAGRTADVLALLDQASGWGVEDIRAIRGEAEFFVAAAKALVAKGRLDEAHKIINLCLDEHGGFDPAYAFLLSLDGPAAMARLDELATRDRFEERPLIWKAQLQLEAGQLEAAEKTARAAIAIDPSDGEQPKGDRMRVYAVLAAILEKKGDAAQAKIFRGAVEAIRLSENTDDWWSAGLLTRAVKMYEEALTHFADAYCIQSRLALRYADLGEMDKAEIHYRRAYELMPDSFGRVESHCFGCEGAFAGPRAQTLAEKVFTALIAKSPEKPQLHYLLGYLRQQQDQPLAALESFRQAVKLDPDYLNAWKKISGLRRYIRVPVTDVDAAVLNQIRLDPLNRHGWDDVRGVADLAGLWSALEAAAKFAPPASGDIYPLAASKAALAKLDPEIRSQLLRRETSDLVRQPTRVILDNEIIRSAQSIFDSLMQ